MSTFSYAVEIETDTQEHANQVMSERLGPDEDYGFDYSITRVKPAGEPPLWGDEVEVRVGLNRTTMRRDAT